MIHPFKNIQMSHSYVYWTWVIWAFQVLPHSEAALSCLALFSVRHNLRARDLGAGSIQMMGQIPKTLGCTVVVSDLPPTFPSIIMSNHIIYQVDLASIANDSEIHQRTKLGPWLLFQSCGPTLEMQQPTKPQKTWCWILEDLFDSGAVPYGCHVLYLLLAISQKCLTSFC